jgi:hypothetical protein
VGDREKVTELVCVREPLKLTELQALPVPLLHWDTELVSVPDAVKLLLPVAEPLKVPLPVAQPLWLRLAV